MKEFILTYPGWTFLILCVIFMGVAEIVREIRGNK